MKKGKCIGKIFAIALILAMIGTTFGRLPSVAEAADKFNIGDTVEVTANLNVRTGPGTSYPEITDPDYPGYAPEGTTGTVLNGPSSADGYIWWQVDFGPGLYSGWSVEDWLEKVTLCPHSCWDRSVLSDNELADLVRSHFSLGGVPQTGESIRVTAYAIAKAESGGNPSACGAVGEIGLWQIHPPSHPSYDECLLFEEDYNANAAMEISSYGTNWNPWCTYEETCYCSVCDGSYRDYLTEARKHFYPKVTSFSVSQTSINLGESVTVYYSVSDDIGLDRVELWRAVDVNGDGQPDWPSNPQDTKPASGQSAAGYFEDSSHSSPNTYWYGIHVADNSGAPEAWNDEGNSRTGGSPGVFGPIQVEVVAEDTVAPTVNAFSVVPSSVTSGNAFTISYTVSDTGGSGLGWIQLWRKYETASWEQVDSTTLSGVGNGPYLSSFYDTPLTVGTYWYGIHVGDNEGNWITEMDSGFSPIEVEVIHTNSPPNIPSNPSPTNHATSISINSDLSWTGGDPDPGDTVTYDVYFGTSSSPPQVSSDQSGTTYELGTLAYNTEYYWKIVATDNYGASTAAPLWDFITRSEPSIGTWYVDDDKVQYPSADFTKIQEAVDAASPGDEIIVYPGTYNENVYANKPHLTIQTENGAESTIVQAANPDNHVIEVTADYVTIGGFTVKGATWVIGISLSNANHCTISDNKVLNNRDGILLSESDNNTLAGNNVLDNGFGIRLSSSNGNILLANDVQNNDEYGIELWYTSDNTLVQNTMSGNKRNLCVYGWSLSQYLHNIDTSNRVDGKAVQYLINKEGLVIDSSWDVGYLGVVNSKNIIVRDLMLVNNVQGLLFAFVTDSRIEGVTVSNNSWGIYLHRSSNNVLEANISSDNDWGVRLEASPNNTLTSNIIYGNHLNFGVNGYTLPDYTQNIDTTNIVNGKSIQYLVCKKDLVIDAGWDVGYLAVVDSYNIIVRDLTMTDNRQGVLFAYTSDSKIENVNVSNNGWGIHLCHSTNNILKGNTVTEYSGGYSIYLQYSTKNTLIDNILWNNWYGIYLQDSENNVLRGNSVLNNWIGLDLSWSNDNTIYLNDFENRHYNMYSTASTNIWESLLEITYSYNSNTYISYLGNYWSDYIGSDADGDGIGEIPYPIDSDADNYPLVEPFKNYEIGEDTTSPSVSSISPQNGEVDVPISTKVTAMFSEAMDISTMTTESFTLISSAVSGTVTYDPATYIATFTPDADLEYDHTYTAILSTAITDLAGNPLTATYSWSFTTESSTVLKPVITSPLEIIPETDKHYVCDTLTARFTIKNIGNESITFAKLLVGGRFNDGQLPNGQYPDFTSQSLTLDPSQSYQYEGSLELTEAGDYHFFCAYQTPDDEWNASIDLGPGLTDEDRVKDITVLVPEGPYICSIDPALGAPGIEVTIKGFNFEAFWSGFVYFGSTNVPIGLTKSWSDSEIVTEVPGGKGIVDVIVESDSNKSNSVEFTYNDPFIDQIDPSYGRPGEQITISGKDFGYKDLHPTFWVKFGKSLSPKTLPWTDTKILAEVPSDFGTGINDIKMLIKLIAVARGILTPEDIIIDIIDDLFTHNVMIPIGEGRIEVGVRVRTPTDKESNSKVFTYDVDKISLSDLLSAGKLRIYDSQGRVTGLVDGEIKEEIPYSYYANNTILIVYPSDSYRWEVVGSEEGVYGLRITFVEEDEVTTFSATDIPTALGSVHEYTINRDALSQGEEGVTVDVDSDGDGITEYTLTAGNVLTGDDFAPPPSIPTQRSTPHSTPPWGYCFIATAVFDTPMAEEIQILREFRDKYLLTNPLGQAFVDFYYKVSPPIANFITYHPSLKPIVRAGLMPAVAMSAVVVNTNMAEKMAIIGLLVLVSLAVAIWIIRRRNGDPEYY